MGIAAPPGSLAAMLSPAALARLDQVAIRRRLEVGEHLFWEGDPAHSMYVVSAGLLRIERVAATGQRQVLTLAGPGDVVGELAVLDGSRRSATGVAMVELVVDVISADEVHRAIHVHPEIAVAIARQIAARQRALTDQLMESTAGTAVSRTAARLLQLVDPSLTAGSYEIEVRVSQAELAAWAGLSREGTVKALRALRSTGVIATARQRITVLDVAALRLAADEL